MSNTLSDKTNKSIADIANKIMQEQPTKVRDFADTKPIESDMVQRVMNLNVPNRFIKEGAEQLDEASYSAKAARAGKDIGKPGKNFAKIAAGAAERYGSEAAGKRVAGAVLAKLRKEEVEQIEEARFGKAIDPSKLSAAARARLEARAKKAGKETPKAEPAPTSAAVGKRAGKAAPKAKESPMAALAQSFGAKKKAAPKAEPKDETPAQKVRRQNMERQKEYYAKGGSRSGMNVGAGGRTSITGHNTSTAGGAVNAVKSQGRIKTGGLHSVAVDEELKGNQTALDVAKPYGKLTAQDFKALRAKHKKGN